MSVLFCRRLRLEIDLSQRPFHEPPLPDGYHWLNWSPELLERHAAVKFRCFQQEQDSRIFRSLRELSGCRHLMEYISGHEQFVPSATWLLVARAAEGVEPIDCGTVQGIAAALDFGAIQNVGILAEHRGQGLGRALLLKSLRGLQESGINHVSLEVTAANDAALRLYVSLGFRPTKTLFREVDG